MTSVDGVSYENMKTSSYLFDSGSLELRRGDTDLQMNKCQASSIVLSPSSISDHSTSSVTSSSSTSRVPFTSGQDVSIAPFTLIQNDNVTVRLPMFESGAKLDVARGQALEFEPFNRPHSSQADQSDSYSDSSSFLDCVNQARFAHNESSTSESKKIEPGLLSTTSLVGDSFRIDSDLKDTKTQPNEMFTYSTTGDRSDSEEGHVPFGQQFLDTTTAYRISSSSCMPSNADFNFLNTPSETASSKSFDSLISEPAVVTFGGKIKKRKRRILFTKSQTYELEQRFKKQRYLSSTERETMSQALNLSATQIKIWFQNHRYKIKKCYQEKHPRLAKASSTSSSKSAGSSMDYSTTQRSSESSKAKNTHKSSISEPSSSTTKELEKPKAFKQLPTSESAYLPNMSTPLVHPSSTLPTYPSATYQDQVANQVYSYAQESSHLPSISQLPDSEQKYSAPSSYALSHMHLHNMSQDPSDNFYHQYSNMYYVDPAAYSCNSSYAQGALQVSPPLANSYNPSIASYPNEYETDVYTRESFAKRPNRAFYKYFNGFCIENNCCQSTNKQELNESTWAADNNGSYQETYGFSGRIPPPTAPEFSAQIYPSPTGF